MAMGTQRPKVAGLPKRKALLKRLSDDFKRWRAAEAMRRKGAKLSRRYLRRTLRDVLEMQSQGIVGDEFVAEFGKATGKRKAWAYRMRRSAVFAEKAGLLDPKAYNDPESWAHRAHVEILERESREKASPAVLRERASWDPSRGAFEDAKPMPSVEKMSAVYPLFKSNRHHKSSLARKYAFNAREAGDLAPVKQLHAEMKGREIVVVNIDTETADVSLDVMTTAVLGFLAALAAHSREARETLSRTRALLRRRKPFQIRLSGSHALPKDHVDEITVAVPLEESVTLETVPLDQEEPLSEEEEEKLKALIRSRNERAEREALEEMDKPKWDSERQAAIFDQ